MVGWLVTWQHDQPDVWYPDRNQTRICELPWFVTGYISDRQVVSSNVPKISCRSRPPALLDTWVVIIMKITKNEKQ